MGIKNLNKLVKKHPISKVQCENLIVDGYNVVITLIQSILASIRTAPVRENIIETFKFMVDRIGERIKDLINRTVNSNECQFIYFVIDGLEQKPLELESGEVIDIKGGEHEKRAKAMESQKERILESINKIEDTEMIEVETERRFFELGSNFHYLIFPVLYKVYDIMDKDNFIMIESIYEADYTIANLAHDLNDSIIMSLDTDFYVMCCDLPNTYIYNIKDSKLYNPYSEWNDVLSKFQLQFDKRFIYRLAPLFGNDYTANETGKQSIMSAEDEKWLKCVIMKDEEPTQRQRKLMSFKECIKYNEDTIRIEELDAAVLEFSKNNELYKNYYENYRRSVSAYENMSIYNEYEIYVPKNVGTSEIEKLFPNPKTFRDTQYDDLLD